MKKQGVIATIIIILFCYVNLAHGQQTDRLVLQSLKNQKKERALKPNVKYEFTINNRMVYSNILSFTDSTITLFAPKSLLFSEAEIETIRAQNNVDHPFFKYDTIAIRFSSIQSINIYYFSNREFLVMPGYFALIATAGIPFVPLASWIQTGAIDMQALKFTTIMAAVTWTIVYIGTRKRCYDTLNQWMIMVEYP